jgi:hypothetical protein
LADAGYLAANKSRLNASNHLALVAEQMTPEQIAEAQRLAREWLAAHAKK